MHYNYEKIQHRTMKGGGGYLYPPASIT